VLEDTNLKLTSVITDITGKSGRAILHALLQGEQDPEVLAELARGRMREKREQLAQAAQGTLSEHHRFLLKSQLRQLDFFDGQLAELDQEIAQRLGIPSGPDDPDPSAGQSATEEPATEETADASVADEGTESTEPRPGAPERPRRLRSAQVIGILDEITGINVRIGEIVMAAVGTVVDRFPTEAQLVSWAGLCPEAKESSGQTAEHENRQREPMAASGPHRGSTSRCSQQGDVPGSLLPTTAQADGA
jgi:transposase